MKNKTAVSTQSYDYVDLGLPSGLLWANCNIGAKAPTDYGDYFMWGSTEPNTNDYCTWENCPFNTGNDDYNKNYFDSVKDSVCPNGILAPEYDAAAVILGNDWRLPTKDDINELIANTEHEWIKNYNNSGINGILFKSNYNENHSELGTELFIPAAGYRHANKFNDQNYCARLWCSSLYETIVDACVLCVHPNMCYLGHGRRFGGFNIRAVTK